MKNKLFTIALAMLVLSMGIISAAGEDQQTSILQTSIYPQDVSISVPDEIIMPNVAPGYVTPDKSFDVVNTGTNDITISASITTQDDIISDEVLFLKKNQVDNLTAAYEFNFEILKPTVVGGTRSETIFAVLDLSGFTNEITEPMINQTYDLVFTALPYNI